MSKKIVFILIAVLFAMACKQEYLTTVTVYHTAGIGGMYWPRQEPAYENKETGGIGVLKNYFEREYGKKLLLDSGDWFSETPEGSIGKGSYILKMMRMAGYDATGLSYTDLAPGWATMSENIRNSEFTVLSSNIKTRGGAVPSYIPRSIIKEINGVKIGIFSLVIKNDKESAGGRLGEIKIFDEIEAAKAVIDDLKNKGADAVILLVDVAQNENNYEERAILEQVEGINIVLAGAPSGEKTSIEEYDNAYIVKTEPFLIKLTKLKLNFDFNKKLAGVELETIPLSKEKYGEDEAIKKIVDDLRSATFKRLNHVIAEAEDLIADVDTGPSVLGEIIAGCIKDWAKADIGIINSDPLRVSIPKGKITEYSLYEVYPYNDTVMSVRIRGEELKNILEKSLLSKNNFPQISGMTVEYNMSEPEGSKVKSIKIRGGKVSPGTIYRLATTDHIMAGGFGHDEFVNAVEFKNTRVDIRTLLRQCLYRKKKISNFPLNWKEVK
ncbi:5'-Nucleotidase domain protein [Elusimicrobium minutum Pei191]|uniref:5'-Nucleotidase domain protein n=1 Tax=Elusimicrobium minutum (strain Pei191) TaxID=445932 RepID=B2KES5_ELUMP|nr:5'-nucleotidase C-terminal domain-containing protein [Elusimicrobium minutum]ACC99021.1 5'-Nucleotidase domain protein [Elusimicrobium minutum Pei191]